MIISAFDIASRKTGWCVGDGLTVPEVGCFEFNSYDQFETVMVKGKRKQKLIGTDLGGLLDRWDTYLNYHFERYRPDVAIYERPIKTKIDTLPTLRKLYSMGAHLEFVCRRRGIECSEVDLHAIKKEVTGNAMAEKDPIVAVARRCGLKLPSVGYEDAADAWGAWLIALRTYSPDISRKWDRVVWNPRGTFL